MAVITRIDSRSAKNNSVQLRNEAGEIIAIIEVVPSADGTDIAKMRNESNLRISAANGVEIVKGNGASLRKK